MRHRTRFAIALTASSLLLGACGSATERDTTGGGAEEAGFSANVPLDDSFDPEAHFSYAGAYPPSNFDPFASASGLDQTYLAPIYDRLIYRAPDGSLEPMLATAWTPTEDNLALVVELREGLTFTDGAPFDAQAVKINLDRYLEETSRLRQELTQVTSVEVIDSLTVQINVSDGIGALPATLAARAGMMASPQAISSGDLSSNPVGIGPYTATSVTPGTSVALTKTEGYWEPEVQRVATMELFGIPEGQARYGALVSNQLTASEIAGNQVPNAQGEGFELISGPTPLIYFLGVNTATAPFDNPDVRKALSMAIDREGIGQGVFEGYCEPQIQLWPESSDAYDDDFGDGLEHFPYDPEQAQELLDGTDYQPGETYAAVLTNTTTSVQLAEVIQANLAEIGITISVNPQPSGGIIENFAIQKSMPLAVSGYTGPPDPAAVIDRNLTPEAPYNPGGEVYATLNDIADKGANTTDQAERKVAYLEYMEEFVEAVPHIIPICMAYRTIAYEGVSNLYASSDYVDLRGVAVTPQ